MVYHTIRVAVELPLHSGQRAFNQALSSGNNQRLEWVKIFQSFGWAVVPGSFATLLVARDQAVLTCTVCRAEPMSLFSVQPANSTPEAQRVAEDIARHLNSGHGLEQWVSTHQAVMQAMLGPTPTTAEFVSGVDWAAPGAASWSNVSSTSLTNIDALLNILGFKPPSPAKEEPCTPDTLRELLGDPGDCPTARFDGEGAFRLGPSEN